MEGGMRLCNPTCTVVWKMVSLDVPMERKYNAYNDGYNVVMI